jgi:hypothetical protein
MIAAAAMTIFFMRNRESPALLEKKASSYHLRRGKNMAWPEFGVKACLFAL